MTSGATIGRRRWNKTLYQVGETSSGFKFNLSIWASLIQQSMLTQESRQLTRPTRPVLHERLDDWLDDRTGLPHRTTHPHVLHQLHHLDLKLQHLDLQFPKASFRWFSLENNGCQWPPGRHAFKVHGHSRSSVDNRAAANPNNCARSSFRFVLVDSLPCPTVYCKPFGEPRHLIIGTRHQTASAQLRHQTFPFS